MRLYTIKKGDTLYKISQKYNVPMSSIIELNKLKNPNELIVGTTLSIPDSIKGTYKITINTKTNKLTLYLNGKIVKTYPVATGKKATPTPKGNWTIIKKGLWGGPFGGYFMQLSVPYGTYGIHGTNQPLSIGRSVSHGCVRMYSNDAKELYYKISIGTPVKII